MLLTIDAGNTRTKWAVFNADGMMQSYGACFNDALGAADFSPSLLGYERVIISNVAGEQHAALLAEMLSTYAIPVRWIKASSEACGVVNLYAKTQTLGSDRWAALISAWHRQQTPCVVVNAGTAVTIDALNNIELNGQTQLPNHDRSGVFIGGLILPGLSLMQQSLGLATAQLPTASLEPEFTAQTHPNIFATNTLDAIQSGALHAIIGAIILMVHELHTLSQQSPAIIISGGNAKTIYDSLVGRVTNQVLIVDNLVLQGLCLIENFMSTNSVQSELQ